MEDHWRQNFSGKLNLSICCKIEERVILLVKCNI